MDLAPTAPALAIFSRIIDRLCRAVAMRERKGPDPLVLAAACLRILGIKRRFAALVQKIQAGTLRPPRARAARPADAPPRPSRPPKPGARLPRGRAWLLRLVPCDAANFAGQLRHQFETNPEMAALLAAAPGQMGRVLRPLCHMLGMDPPAVLRRPEPEPEPAAGGEGGGEGDPAAGPPPPRARKPRAKKVRWRMARMPPERGLIFY